MVDILKSAEERAARRKARKEAEKKEAPAPAPPPSPAEKAAAEAQAKFDEEQKSRNECVKACWRSGRGAIPCVREFSYRPSDCDGSISNAKDKCHAHNGGFHLGATDTRCS